MPRAGGDWEVKQWWQLAVVQRQQRIQSSSPPVPADHLLDVFVPSVDLHLPHLFHATYVKRSARSTSHCQRQMVRPCLFGVVERSVRVVHNGPRRHVLAVDGHERLLTFVIRGQRKLYDAQSVRVVQNRENTFVESRNTLDRTRPCVPVCNRDLKLLLQLFAPETYAHDVDGLAKGDTQLGRALLGTHPDSVRNPRRWWNGILRVILHLLK
mmetsp:Transcript_41420/g.109707  ORF Transcript_41420/g.109707 Transcript_41420/m.109707 type:complete len:211 (+) Transcript_41420:422-1054(+)